MPQPPSPADRERADRALAAILAVLTRRGPSGPVYSDDDLRRCLAILFIQVSRSLSPTPGTLRNAAAAAALVGITKKDPAEVVESKIAAYAQKLPAALKADLARALRDLVVAGAGNRAANVADLIGAAVSNVPVSAHAPAEGSVRGGMAARLANTGKKKPSNKSSRR